MKRITDMYTVSRRTVCNPCTHYEAFCTKKKVDSDEDEEDDESPLLHRKSPFDIISDGLYSEDYQNRIISIAEDIDGKCFVYAKMIEHWNREDIAMLAVKSEICEKMRTDKTFSKAFETFTSIPINARTDEDEKKVQSILLPFAYRYSEVTIVPDEIIQFQPKPIKIKFNSPGGWLLGYETLSDVIRMSKTPIIGINMGIAYSAAAFLLVSCHHRLALQSSRIMIHKGSGGYNGSFAETDSSHENYKAEVDKMLELFLSRTNITESVLAEKMNPDWYFSAKEALNYGLVDRIVSDISDLL